MKASSLIIALVLVITSGCGTTRILTNHSDAEIHIDNVKKGSGEVELKRMGFPHKSNISVHYQNKKVAERELKREFDLGTLVLGLYTYGLGFAFGWRYPKEVFVPIDLATYNDLVSPHEEESQTSWMRPPRVWGKE